MKNKYWFTDFTNHFNDVIDFITVQSLILKDTNGKGGALTKVSKLHRDGWVLLDNQVKGLIRISTLN